MAPSALFLQVIQGNVQELVSLVESGNLDEAPLLRDYALATIHYQRCQFKELLAIKRRHEADAVQGPDSEKAPFLAALSLRWAIRNHEVNAQNLSVIEQLPIFSSPWEGELSILMGMGHVQLDDHERAIQWFRRSVVALEREGARRKACKARLNIIASESCLRPDRHFIAEYNDIYRRALKCPGRELSVASTCLLNISREFQRMGAPLPALRYCQRAIVLLKKDFGSKTYYLTLAHRCHLFLETGRISEAREDYQFVSSSSCPEAMAAIEVLRDAFVPEKLLQAAQQRVLTPTWKERRDFWIESGAPDLAATLSPMEQRLVAFLGVSKKSKNEITDHLWGDRLKFEIRLARLKSMLTTLRKKVPDLVVHEHGYYRLAESFSTFQQGRKNAG